MTSTDVHQDLIRQAVRLLRQGALVSFPTETVYGLGADASNREALKLLYATKGRPASHPVIVHLHSIEILGQWAIDVPSDCFKLAEAFWPGPLTMVLKRAQGVLDEVTGGQETVAIRVPNHPLALDLLREFGGGLAAPSANRFGRLSPTQAKHVLEEFKDEVALVLDGGACNVGIESTIVDMTSSAPRILRPGMLSRDDIANVIAGVAPFDLKITHKKEGLGAEQEVRVPGALPVHYAPLTPLHVVSSAALGAFIEQRLASNEHVGVISFQPRPELFSAENWLSLSSEPTKFARELYTSLRQLDHKHLDLIVVESPPSGDPRWSGVLDRLGRASSKG